MTLMFIFTLTRKLCDVSVVFNRTSFFYDFMLPRSCFVETMNQKKKKKINIKSRHINLPAKTKNFKMYQSP